MIKSQQEIHVRNSMRDRLLQGHIASTLSIRLIRTAELPMMAKTIGFDGILIDMEHSSIDMAATSQLSIAALYAGITPIVRVPSKDSSYVSRVLDGGALGVIVPHIRSLQDAKDVVNAAKFAPIGQRSNNNSMPHFQFRSLPANRANPVINSATLVILMIETLAALEIVDELAALDGVDSLLIGTSDLTAEMGIPGDFSNPRVEEAYRRTIAACEKSGKWTGIGGLHARMDLVEKFCRMGARWVMVATDVPMFMNAASSKVKEMKDLEGRVKRGNGKSTISNANPRASRL